MPGPGEASSLYTHHGLGRASASPMPSPFLVGTGCRMPLNLLPCKACCHTYLGMEGGIVEMTHSSSFGPEGVGCEGAVGPRSGQGFQYRVGALETESVGREEEPTFTEHPLGPRLSKVRRTR